jgi:hypothetical protein
MKTVLLSVLIFLTGIAYIIMEPHILFYPGLVIKALIIPVLMFILQLNLKYYMKILCHFMLAGAVQFLILITIGFIKQIREGTIWY